MPLVRMYRHPHVRVLPFYNITAPRYDMHEMNYCGFEQMRSEPSSDGSCWCAPSPCLIRFDSRCASLTLLHRRHSDCTHMCHTPQLWRHIFSTLHATLAETRATEPLPLRAKG